MSKISPQARKRLELLVYLVAIVLMIIRVDWWWWGWKIEPFVFGWLTLPMFYQVGIWLVGWLLVYLVVRYIWIESN